MNRGWSAEKSNLTRSVSDWNYILRKKKKRERERGGEGGAIAIIDRSSQPIPSHNWKTNSDIELKPPFTPITQIKLLKDIHNYVKSVVLGNTLKSLKLSVRFGFVKGKSLKESF